MKRATTLILFTAICLLAHPAHALDVSWSRTTRVARIDRGVGALCTLFVRNTVIGSRGISVSWSGDGELVAVADAPAPVLVAERGETIVDSLMRRSSVLITRDGGGVQSLVFRIQSGANFVLGVTDILIEGSASTANLLTMPRARIGGEDSPLRPEALGVRVDSGAVQDSYVLRGFGLDRVESAFGLTDGAMRSAPLRIITQAPDSLVLLGVPTRLGYSIGTIQLTSRDGCRSFIPVPERIRTVRHPRHVVCRVSAGVLDALEGIRNQRVYARALQDTLSALTSIPGVLGVRISETSRRGWRIIRNEIGEENHVYDSGDMIVVSFDSLASYSAARLGLTRIIRES